MKCILLALILCLPIITNAQHGGYNSDTGWSRFSMQDTVPQPGANDTCLVFVSNRHFLRDSLRFLDEYVDTSHLNYFFLRKQGPQWQVFQTTSLSDAMELLPIRRDIVVYAEGMGKIFTNNVERAYLMTTQYGVNVVMFDYSSINTTFKPAKNFKFARTNARISAGQYFTLMKDFQAAREANAPWISGERLTLFFHSMGNIILRQMMLTQHYTALNSYPFVDNVVINAACVPQRDHIAWVKDIRFAGNIYIHYNKNDIQLKGAHLLTFQDQLGEKIHQRAPNAHYINFHDYVGWKHSYFLNFPFSKFQLSDDMKMYFSALLRGNAVSMLPGKNTAPLLTSKASTGRD
ncbi:Alpha/beta hydrolase of unknown function [Chitinophaga costaii]|uniref:Alpha/beta hydrolase n=1 Tax=Chitinophaga costaii TaxID=1335309 RepID=A0A1C4FQA1_9BACT|nr:alpha/beta hydrolase [Chitinophaga costaii]PUZ20458.1 alpha/beta hydrolase [Chitinophaga costaii]SCC58149.1 Alpha/beta hydrolase of unknown function [Chitinophaga costaii]